MRTIDDQKQHSYKKQNEKKKLLTGAPGSPAFPGIPPSPLDPFAPSFPVGPGGPGGPVEPWNRNKKFVNIQ